MGSSQEIKTGMRVTWGTGAADALAVIVDVINCLVYVKLVRESRSEETGEIFKAGTAKWLPIRVIRAIQ